MSDAHPIRCSCGALTGAVERRRRVNRGSCYCRDCQAFARFLGRADQILDAHGGTEVVQIAPRWVCISSGRENLACMRLSPNGLLRWYAACCNTPIGNTLANPKLAFVGLVRNCLESRGPRALDDSFGPARMRANTRYAQRASGLKDVGLPAAVATVVGMIAWSRLTGAWRHSPFFDAVTGEPVVAPRVLTPAERAQLQSTGP